MFNRLAHCSMCPLFAMHNCQECWLMASTAVQHMERLEFAPSQGQCVWPSDLEAAGSVKGEAQVFQKLAEALKAGTRCDDAPHLVRIQIRFDEHEENRFGLLLNRPPHPVSTIRFAHRSNSILKGQAQFADHGEWDVNVWQENLEDIATHTDAWGFGVQLEEPLHLVCVDEAGQLMLQEMALPAVEEGWGINIMLSDGSAEEHQEQPEDEEEIDEASLEIHLMLKNVAPFCSGLNFAMHANMFHT
jgi:hypothetical protein